MSAPEIVRHLAGIALRCSLALILTFSFIGTAVAQTAEYDGGPTDDPYTPIVNTKSTPVDPNKWVSGGGSADSVTINTIDPSGFPEICTYVTVTHNGETVEGLDPDSFCVRQDGIIIDSFTVVEQTADSCITRICLVIDRSGSMSDGGKLTAAKNAAKRFVRNMSPFDRAAVVSFGNCWTVNQNFTSDTTLLIAAINSLTASGRTAALDGIWKGLDLTKVEAGSNKAVIALSDGMENWSQNCGSGLPDGLTDAQGFTDDLNFLDSISAAIGAPVYTISLGTDFDAQYLEDIANATGGEYHHAPTNATLDAIYDAIKLSICTRYLICYTSPDAIANGDCHDVIICRDNADNDKSGKPDCYVCDTTEYCEPYPPVITIDVDPACRHWEQPLELCATVTDSDTPPESLVVKLYYRIFEPGGAYAEITPTRNGNVWCYTIAAAKIPCGTDSVEFYFTATDGTSSVASPANAPLSSHQVDICPNHPPTCEFNGQPSPPVCTPPIDFVSLNLTDVDNNKLSCTLYGDGELVPGGWQNVNPTPNTTAHVYIVCIDSCGDSCNISFERFYPERQPVPCYIPDGGDTAFFLCDPGLVSFPVTDSDSSTCEVVEGAGAIVNGNWEYNATKDTTITFTVQCIGICDSCRSTYTVAIDVNSPPLCGPLGGIPGPKGGEEQCDSVNFSDHFSLEFKSVSYDDDSNSTWCYELTWDGEDPELSHLTIELCKELTQDNFVSSSPSGAEIGQDGSTGLYGLKWDSDVLPNIPPNTPVQFCFTIDRPLALAQASFVPKAGQNEDIVDVCGPSTNCDPFDPGGDQNPSPCDTTVFLCNPGQVCVPYQAADPDNNLNFCHITFGPGQLINGYWCFDATESGTYIVTIECVDSCQETCSQELCATVVIDEAPVITCPPDVVYECDSVGGFGEPTVVDGGFSPSTVSSMRDSVPGNCPGSYTLRIRYIASDTCGHADTCVQSVQVVDREKPVVTCPTDTIYECHEDVDSLMGLFNAGIWAFGVPTATDNCDPSPTIYAYFVGNIHGNPPCNYYINFGYWAVDGCGNVSDTCYQSIGVYDGTPPEVTCPPDTILSCEDEFPRPGGIKAITPGSDIKTPDGVQWWPFGVPSATDNCDPDPWIDGHFGRILDENPCHFVFEGIYTAVDTCGNIDSCIQIITVVDTTDPVVECPPPSRFECNAIPTFFPPPGAKDACNEVTVGEINRYRADSTCPYEYTIVIVWEARDACGNADTCEQRVQIYDDTPPVLTIPQPVVYNCDSVPAEFPRPTAADQCDPDPSVSIQRIDTVVTGCIREYLIYWVAQDTCGNASQPLAQLVTVLDRTAPVLTCPADTVYECDESPDTIPASLSEAGWPFGIPTATDNCDTDPTIDGQVFSLSGTYPCDYRIDIRYWAVDSCGNFSQPCTQVVHIVDTTAPVITCPPDTTFECDELPPTLANVKAGDPVQKGDEPPAVYWPFGEPTATDNCDDSLFIYGYYSRILDEDICHQQYEIAYVAYDHCFNADTCYQILTVVDTTAPELVECSTLVVYDCQVGKSIEEAKLIGPVMPTFRDNCDQDPWVNIEVDTIIGEGPCVEIDWLVWAVDTCGNVSDTCFQRMIFQDTIAPVITCPDTLVVNCPEPTILSEPPTATDNCTDPIVEVIERRVDDSTCTGDYYRVIVWEARDNCGNADTCEQVIHVTDTLPPFFPNECPPLVFECDSVPTEFTPPFAEDFCDATPDVHLLGHGDTTYGGCPQRYTWTIFWEAIDDCGNADTCSQQVLVTDTTAPVVTCPPDTTFECSLPGAIEKAKQEAEQRIFKGDEVDPFPFGDPSAVDNCDPDPTIQWTFWDVIPQGPCYVRFVLAYRAIDTCGNISELCFQNVLVVDTTAPEITCPADTLIECDEIELNAVKAMNPGDKGPVNQWPFGMPTATDNCDDSVAIYWTFGGVVYQDTCVFQFRVLYWAVDNCENFDSCSQLVTVADTTAPVIDCPNDTTVQCALLLGDPKKTGDWAAFAANIKGEEVPPGLCFLPARDNCTPEVRGCLVGFDIIDSLCPLIVDLKFVARDRCGNESDTCHWVVTIQDTVPPSISCPEPARIDCEALWDGVFDGDSLGWPVAADDCDLMPEIHLLGYTQLGEGCPYIIRRAFVAVDTCGNVSDTCYQDITVYDDTPPEIVCPENQFFECDVDTTLFAWPTASDSCDPEPTIELVVYEKSPVGNGECAYVLRRGWRAYDECKNVSETCYQSITVGDTTRPEITCPPDTIVDCSELERDGSGKAMLESFANGTAAKDAQGCHEYDFRYGTPTATDNCDTSPAMCLQIVQLLESDSCRTSFALIFTAMDDCGNISDTCHQIVTFTDTTAPVVVCAPDTVVYCAGDGGRDCFVGKSGRVSLDEKGFLCDFRLIDTVYDACDQNVDYEAHLSVHFEKCPYYIIAEIWAVDDCGNVSDTCTWQVTFLDTLAPEITCPPDINVECGETPGDWGMATAVDDCDTLVVPVLIDVDTVAQQGNCFIQVARTFSATDECGNESRCRQTIIIGDSTAPVITCPPDTVVNCTENLRNGDNPKAQFADWATKSPPVGDCFDYNGQFGLPTATDNCSEYRICLYDVTGPEGDSCRETFTLHFVAVDACGNADTCEQHVTFVDNEGPVLVCASDTTIYCDREKAECIEFKGTEPFKLDQKFLCGFRMIDTVYDACCEDVQVYSRLTFHLNKCPAYIKAFIWAVDCCGNYSDTCTWILNIADTAAPVITCPEDLTFECSDTQGDWGWPTATDNCTEAVITLVDQDTTVEGCHTVITRTFSAKDRCDLESRCRQTITISDTTDPVCDLPDADTIFLCSADTLICLPVSATDNCDQDVLCEVVDGAGTIANGMWCFSPTGPGPVTAYIRCTDDCGNTCEGNFTITFELNRPPVCELPNDTTIYLCDPTLVELKGQTVDPDGNLALCMWTLGPEGDTKEQQQAIPDTAGVVFGFVPESDMVLIMTSYCVDSCGEVCADTARIVIDITEPPVCYPTPDTNFAFCDPEEVCLQIEYLFPAKSSSDIVANPKGKSKGGRPAPPKTQLSQKGALAGCTIINGPGMIRSGYWCWTPPDYDTTVTIIVECRDTCNHTCLNEFTVGFDLNEQPVCSLTVELVDPICTPETDFVPYLSYDPDGTSDCEQVSGPGALVPGGWQYPNPTPGTTAIVVIVCTDTCGDTCMINFERHYPERVPVICNLPEDIDTVLCQPTTLSFPVSGGEGSECRVISGPGSVDAGSWFYFADRDTSFCVTIECKSLCDSCRDEFCVTIEMNDPPVCELPNDTTIFLCAPTQVCLPLGASDPNGNFAYCQIDYETKSLDYGYIENGLWCYNAYQDGSITVPVICYDSCGASCRGSFTVTFDLNDPPVCELPNDTTIFLCDPGLVCLPIGATDVNGNFRECSFDEPSKTNGYYGYIENGQWCYNATEDVQVTVYIVCYDSCNAYCYDNFTVTIDVNEPPVCNDVPDTAIFLCEPTEFCLPVGSKDPDGQLVSCQVVAGPGAVTENQWCFTPAQSGVYNVTIRCEDSCGDYCDESFSVTVNLNDPPECISPPVDTTIYMCRADSVCIGGFGGTDPDGNLMNCVILDSDKRNKGIPQGEGLVWCDFISTDQTVLLTIQCTDSCGAVCSRDVFIHFIMNIPPVIDLGGDISTQVGDGEVCFHYTNSDPDQILGLIEELILSPAGAVIDTAANTICWTPEEGGNFMFVGKVTDSCGADDFDTAFVLVSQPAPPNCIVPGDTTFRLCGPAQICLPVNATSLNPPVTCQVTEGPGTVSGGNWCYTPQSAGVYEVTIRCTDNAGGQCVGTFTVTVNMNAPPICSAPADTGFFVCPGQAVSLQLTAVDPDNNISGYLLLNGPGSITGSVWSYTPPSEDEVFIRWRVVDSCGRADTCQTRVRIYTNDPPVFVVRDDTTITVCTPGVTVCRPLSIYDPNDNVATVEVISGVGSIQKSAHSWSWCFAPATNGTYPVTVRVTDSCGLTVQRSFSVTFILIDPPACALPASGTYDFCQSPVCIPIAGNDPPPQRGVTCQIIDGPGYISGGNWCVNITGTQTFSVVIRCTNTCDAQCQIVRNYTFHIDPDCTGTAGVSPIVRGDFNGSGDVNIADLALLSMVVNRLNQQGKTAATDVSSAAAGYQYDHDVNCDGKVDRADVAYMTEFLFNDGPVPCDPTDESPHK